MQTRSPTWQSLFNGAHKTEYKYVINGVDYLGDKIKDTAVITKPLLEKPAIGRTCTGSLTLKIYPQGNIPKAATVNAYCRLSSNDGETVSEWLPQGKYYISTRTGSDVLTLNCLDKMILAGRTYLDKTAFTEWPQSMQAVVNEIAEIMQVNIDSRTSINSGRRYVVDYPNEDMLMSEVLGMIAAAHGGNWIMTESGELRLIVLATPAVTATQEIGKTHGGYVYRGKTQTVSRVILVDDADNDFTAGDDTGLTISAECNYATQEVANTLCNSAGSVLYGVTYEPYEVNKAYLDPAIELGDTLSFQERDGTTHKIVLQTIITNCTVACTAKITANIENETDDEYPYLTSRDLSLQRTVKTNQTYFGNRINRKEGFVSELVVNDTVWARLTANATLFCMQSYDTNTGWTDCIYFDTATKKYVITADVTINGVVTFTDLSTAGSTTINGSNITTGTIAANRVDLSNYSTSSQVQSLIESNIDGLSLSVSNGEESSTISLKAGNTTLSSKTISFSGVVTFTDLSTTGSTTITGSNITTGTIDASEVTITNINASNITSGTISADRIDVTNLKVKNVYAPNDYLAITSTNANLYVGGSSSALTFNYLYLMCKTEIRFCFTTPNSAPIAINAAESAFCPAARSSSWMLGTASYKWYKVYAATFSGDTGNITTVNATTVNATTVSASTISGVSSLSISGTLTAGTVNCSSGTVYASTVSTTNLTANGSDCRVTGTVRIGGSGGYIGFFGKTPISKETYSYSSISKDNCAAALVELVNCMKHLGLIG